MHWAARLLRKAADRRLKPYGLSSGNMPVITALMDEKELSQKALAAAAAIEQPTMAEMLLRMERSGLIHRRADPADGRGSLISLSSTVVRLLPEIQAEIEKINEEALSGMSQQDREGFRGNMMKLIAALEEKGTE
jgi:DNA-binding MarR family transcriptional regulator